MQHLRQKDVQQLEGLASIASNWRILNLNRITKQLRDVQGPGVDGFFNGRMSNAIIIKHTLRDHEGVVFHKPPMIATKVLVPLDETNLASGAISFFVGERGYASTLKEFFGINVARTGFPGDRDAQILAKLDETPTFDLFMLRELLKGFEINPDYFHVSLVEDMAIKSFIIRELTPLIRIAIGDVTPNKINKFVDSIFGAEIGSQAADFFQALGLATSTWGSVVFAWKAALFYESSFAVMQRRFETMLGQLRQLQTYGHNELYPRSTAMEYRERLHGFVVRAYQMCASKLQSFNSARRASILKSAQVMSLKNYLEELPESIHGFGAASALVDHVLSYWSFRTRGLDYARIPSEIFCRVAAEICAIERQFDMDGEIFRQQAA